MEWISFRLKNRLDFVDDFSTNNRYHVVCAKCISPFDYSHKGVGVAAADSLSWRQLAMEKQTVSYID